MVDFTKIETVPNQTTLPLYYPYDDFIVEKLTEVGFDFVEIPYYKIPSGDCPIDEKRADELARILFRDLPQGSRNHWPTVILSNIRPEWMMKTLKTLQYDEDFLDWFCENDMFSPKRPRSRLREILRRQPTEDEIAISKELFGSVTLDTVDSLVEFYVK